MRNLFLSTVAILALIAGSASPTLAEGQHNGWADESGQGNLDNDNDKANPTNKGQVTLEGPKGQIKNDKTNCNNCTSSGPGNSQK